MVVKNRAQYNGIRRGFYPSSEDTKTYQVDPGWVGTIENASFTKDGLLQFSVRFDEFKYRAILVPYFVLHTMPYEVEP